MNILMALSQLEITGAEVYATTISDILIEKGHKVHIVSDTLNKETKAEYTKLEFNKRSIKNRIKQVKFLLKFIKENNIDVAHAHSRASSWSTHIACKIAGIPLITTVHGRQPVHASRKFFPAFGDCTITVCENIKKHIENDLGVKNASVLRNGINTNEYSRKDMPVNEKKIISIIGRLSGPKGEVAFKLLDSVLDTKKYEVRLIGGKSLPEKFEKYKNEIKFWGYINNLPEKMAESDLIIGAGRVAVEALLVGRPVLAIGEAKSIGILSRKNITDALSSNFGDIGEKLEDGFQWENMKEEIDEFMGKSVDVNELESLRDIVQREFNIENVVNAIEKTYQRELVKKSRNEIPILMYHRVVGDESETGVHGTYVTAKQFEEHLQILKNEDYEALTFEELELGKRFSDGKKKVIITFDDGYVDNYKYAFPVLKKYGYKAVIYLVSHLDYNKWDVENSENPEKRFHLMDEEQLKEMLDYGIEFGGHTKTHPRLSKLSITEAKEEIFDSKKVLEEKLGVKMKSFAYPYGDLNDEVKNLVQKAGYIYGVATDSGPVCISDDLYQIRRIGIFPNITSFGFKRKIKGNYNFIKIKREGKHKSMENKSC